MPLSTYTELQDSIVGWLVRSDLTLVIPDFIRLAEARLNRELRVQRMVQTATGTLIGPSLATPSGFLEVASLTFGTTPVSYVPPETFDAIDASSLSQPCYVTVANGMIEVKLAPVAPGAAYTLRYYQALPALATNTNNWLLDSAPDTYLWASLAEAEPYTMNDERMQLWKARAELAVSQLNGNERRLKSKGMSQRARTA